MKIHKIETTNFRLHADTQIALHDGVTGIIGSNETGKSTILEAILWALFGTQATRGKKESLRWHGAPERRGAAVMLEFEVGGTVYLIERGESNAKVVEVGVKEPLAEGTSAVDEYVPGLLGMSYDEFRASFLCSQKDLGRLTSMGPTERQTFIRQVLGVGRIDDALAACRKRKNELASEVQGMDAGLGERQPLVEEIDRQAAQVVEWEDALSANERQLEDAEEAHAEAATKLDGSANLAKRVQELEAEHRQAEKDMITAEKEADRLSSERREQEKARARIEEAEKELVDLPRLKERRDTLREAKATLSERETLTERAVEIQETLRLDRETVEDAEKQIERFDARAYEAAQARAGAADRSLAELRTARNRRAAELRAEGRGYDVQADNLRKQVEALRELGAESECPTCTRPLGDSFGDVIGSLIKQADELQKKEAECFRREQELEDPSDEEIEAEIERDEAEAELEGLHTIRQDAERARRVIAERTAAIEKMEASRHRISARLAELPDVDFDADDLKATEDKIQVLQNKERALASARGLVAQTDRTESELSRWRETYAKAERTAKNTERAIEELAFDPDAHKELVQAEAAAKAKLDERRVAVARCEETLKAKREARREAEEALKRYDEKAESLRATRYDLRIHEKAAAGLSDFRTAVAGTIRPELEELMSGFVHILTDGRHEAVTLSEDFTPILLEEGIPTEVVSGGTEDVAALAMRLAISQMIAERAGHPIECLVLDEPFGSMDEVRRGNVLNLIRRLRGVFEQVLVISHVAETRDAVDHVVELEYDEALGKTVVATQAWERAVA